MQNGSYVTQFSEPCVSLDVSPVSTRSLPPALQLPLTSLFLPGRLTTILISRFLLDLQSANHKASNPQGSMSISINDTGPGALVFERVIGSLGSSIGIGSVGDECKSSFDNDSDGDGGRLTIQVKDLMGKGGKDDPDSSVDSEGRSGVEMTPLSSPRSPAETSDSERVSVV